MMERRPDRGEVFTPCGLVMDSYCFLLIALLLVAGDLARGQSRELVHEVRHGRRTFAFHETCCRGQLRCTSPLGAKS